MNVKNKALAVVVLVILLLSGFFLAQGINRYNREIEAAINAEEEIIDNTLEDLQRYFFFSYRTRIEHIVENSDAMRQAFADRDRESLYREVLPVFKDLQEENAYFHAWDFTLPDGTVFLRVQRPELHGDDISGTRSIVQAVHESGEPAAGYDIGKHGAIYWVVHPIFHYGRYLGAMEFGIPVKQLVLDLEKKFDTEVTTIIKAGEWVKATLVEEGYRHFGQSVLMTHAGSVYEQLPDDFIFSLDRDQRVELDSKSFILHNCFSLEDFRGEKIGNILLLQDITEEVAGRKNFIVTSVSITGMLVSISFLVLYVSFNAMIGKLENYAEETKRAKEETEKARGELERRVEERTRELNEAYSHAQDQHNFLQSIMESMTHPFYVVDAGSYRIVMANRAALQGEGGAIAEGLTCYRMTHNRDEPCTGEDHPCSLREVRKSKKSQVLEHVHTDHEGHQRHFEIYAYPVSDSKGEVVQVIEYAIDITERKKSEQDKAGLERQLQQSQRLEAMGTLAGGIAHDFNNILSAIFGYTDLIRYEVPANDGVQQKLNEVLKAGERAKDLVRQILTFSRQTEQERRPLQIHLLVKEALKLLRASIPATIEIRQDVRDCGLVLADPTQIHQVIMNLCTNAYHAMRDKGGVLAVSLTPVEISAEDNKASSFSLLPGKYVKLSVSDTGCGIERAVLDRIFDPYFTTKKKEEGTGLGLAVVHGIVKANGGHITVYSEIGVGTTFNVYLPHVDTGESGQKREGLEGRSHTIEELPRGSEKVLLVDDEEPIVDVGRQMLESLGYRVEAFTSSPAAFQAFQDDPDGFDLVITDMTMPSMTGIEMVRKVLALRPGLPIVLCTGFSELMDSERSKMLGVSEFAMKPLVKSEMARIVRRALDRKPDSSGGPPDGS